MLAPDAVVVANAGGISFVRVWYDEVLAGRLAGSAVRALAAGALLARGRRVGRRSSTGSTTASSFCRVVEGFVEETELPVWQLILTGLSWCDRFLEGEPRDRFRDYVLVPASCAPRSTGWDGGPPTRRTSSARSGGRWHRRSPCSATILRRRRRCASWRVRPAAAETSTPTWPRRPCRSWPPTATRTTSRATGRWCTTASRRRSSSDTCMRWPGSATPSCSTACSPPRSPTTCSGRAVPARDGHDQPRSG